MSFQLAFALNASLQIFHLKIHHHVSLKISFHWSMTITLYIFHIKPVIEFFVSCAVQEMPAQSSDL